ncbi:hypothetical protein [Nodularia chucula]|uniref:hypothetical protein n=1 Tax=Nodularia chucula TaxID=3093667 RepID=UPI0039C75429
MKTQLEKFLQQNTAISDEKSLEDYKNVVRLNMYGALAQIIILVGAFGSCIISLINQGFAGVFSLFLLGFAFTFGKQVSTLEEKARTLTCANVELERQYTKISHVWQKKALPDF